MLRWSSWAAAHSGVILLLAVSVSMGAQADDFLASALAAAPKSAMVNIVNSNITLRFDTVERLPAEASVSAAPEPKPKSPPEAKKKSKPAKKAASKKKPASKSPSKPSPAKKLTSNAKLSPFAKEFRDILTNLIKILSANYVILGKDFFKYYKPRAAANARLIKQSVGVRGDLTPLIPAIVSHETAIWQLATDYLKQIEVYVVPVLNRVQETLGGRLSVEQRQQPKVKEMLELYHNVVPDAVYEYQDNLDLCRNRYMHDLEQQLDNLVRLQRQAREAGPAKEEEASAGSGKGGDKLQRLFETAYDEKQAALLKTQQQFWRKVQSIYFSYLEHIERSAGYLLELIK